MKSKNHSHVGRTLSLAAQIVGVQITFAAFLFIDLILIGSQSASNLSVIGLGSSIYIAALVGPLGFVISMAPTISFLIGECKHKDATVTLWHGLYSVLFIGAVLFLMGLVFHPLIVVRGLGPIENSQLQHFVLFSAIGAPATLLFRYFFVVSTTQKCAYIALVINIIALILKLFITLVLMRSENALRYGFDPSQCALITAITSWIATGMASAAYILMRQHFSSELKSRPQTLHFEVFASLVANGFAVALLQGVEAGSVAILGLLVAPFGLVVGAAHQAAMNVAVLCFMIPSAIGIASATLISESLGKGNFRQAEQFLRSGLCIAVALSIGVACSVSLTREPIASIYSENRETQQVIARLLLYVALAQVPDMISMWLTLVLRSFKSFVAPIYMAIIGRGFIGLALGGWASRMPGYSYVDTLWIFLVMGLTTTTPALAFILRRKVRSIRSLREQVLS